MATNQPEAAMFTRYELITLHTVLNARAKDVRDAAGRQFDRWQSAPAGSDEARQCHALYQADLRYANDLTNMAAVIDGLLDNNTHDNFRLQGE